MKTETIEVPSFDGYECIGYVSPRHHNPCYVLSSRNGLIEASEALFEPWLCYRKIKPKRITLEETGEVRPPRVGEWYKNECGNYFLATYDHYEKYAIYKEIIG